MINGETVLALIPARGGSKGLAGKNIKELHGKPLVGWPIEAAVQSKYVDRVIISTDDKKIAEIAKEQGAEVPFLRPTELAGDTATSISVIEHALQYCQSEGFSYRYLIYLEPTSPLTETEDVDKALELLISQRDIADAIVGISKVINAHPIFDVTVDEKGLIAPFITKSFSTPRRQEINDLYFFDGSLYISDVNSLLLKKTFYHERTLGFITPKWKSLEIDDLVDFVCIEAIIRNRHRFKS